MVPTLGRTIRSILTVEWSSFEGLAALRCTAGVAVPLLTGLVLDQPLVGVFGAAGAVGVGFGSFQGAYRGRAVVQDVSMLKALTGEHPVVRTHPETGRKALYVNVGHTARLKGWTEEESAPLLEYLFAHQVRPELTCRFRWEPGSLAFWDNRCAQHNPVNDYHGYRRVMHRVTLAGDKPV